MTSPSNKPDGSGGQLSLWAKALFLPAKGHPAGKRRLLMVLGFASGVVLYFAYVNGSWLLAGLGAAGLALRVWFAISMRKATEDAQRRNDGESP